MNGTTHSDGGEQPDEQIYAHGVPATGLQAAMRTDGGDENDEDAPSPECVLCGFVPTGLSEGLFTVPEEEVPADARDVNEDVVDTDAAPEGAVWICEECKFGEEEDA